MSKTMVLNDNRFYKNTDIALTPWQQECETKIVRKGLRKREAELLRSCYELVHHLGSIQHWAGTNYSRYLLEKAQERIDSITL